jgi:nitrogen fixation/metabolism regulation signal transduction histidine kinase
MISFTAAGYLVSHKYYLFAFSLFIAGLIITRVIVRIYESIYLATASFFESLRNDDTSIHFPANSDNKTFVRLYESMNLLNDHFQKIKLQNEYNEAYYRSLIQHSAAGLLVLNDKNHIELINRTACNFAGISPDSTNPDMLKIKHHAFYEAICSLKPGENITYRNLMSDNLQMLLFRATMIKRQDAILKLVSIQDIRSELESRELESYRKLMSVMTHEIMNLLTPLTTVAKELFTLFDKQDHYAGITELDELTIKTATNGLRLIDEQSNGVLNFVNSYRKISKLPRPEFNAFDTEEWAEQLKIVFVGKMKEHNIIFSITTDKSLRQITADKKLLNQVMINIINNAIDAVMEIERKKIIEIRITKSVQNKVIIKIVNNGPPILKGLQEKIFVPFFTTKKNGSGIGLSISQEIMKLHAGSILIVPEEGGLTCFMIEF